MILTLPMVLLCIIVASLVECFLVLPAHLKRQSGQTGSALGRHLAGSVSTPVWPKFVRAALHGAGAPHSGLSRAPRFVRPLWRHDDRGYR
jgi:hypothetical protein